MAIAQLGHITEISCVDWLDPAASQADREHSAERVAECVERPLTRAMIDLLVEAVAG